MLAAQTAPSRLSCLADDPSLPSDPGLPSGLWLAQEGELPEELWLTEEPDPAEDDTTVPEVLKAGRWDRARGDGGGFAAGACPTTCHRDLCWPGSPPTHGPPAWGGSAMMS